MGRKARVARKAELGLEPLETRQLLSGGKIRLASNGAKVSDDELKRAILQLTQKVPVRDRRIAYTTDDGTKVVVNLYGKGSLRGTHVRDDGALEVVFNSTNNETRIIATAQGPHGRAVEVPLAGIRDADTTPNSNSSSGVDPVAAVQMRDFVLVDDGTINLTGGVLQLNLKAIGKRSSVYLREGTPVSTGTQTASIIATGGATVGGVNPVESATITTAAPTGGPSGIEIRINRVDAGPLNTPPFGNPQIYAVDPAAATLIRFDAVTGDPTLTVSIPGLVDTTPPVGLAYRDHETLVFVGNGQEVIAFNAVSGAFVGTFSTANLSTLGFDEVDGIASSRTRTLLTSNDGVGVRIDVGESLLTGQAVPLGTPYVPTREFILNGDATGIAGSSILYAGGAAHFDSFQPNLFQFGNVVLAQSGLSFREQSRNALYNLAGTFRNAGPNGLDTTPFFGFGSIDTTIAALVARDAATGKNVLQLYAPGATGISGFRALNYAPQLYGLSESLHPELQQASLIDITGNLKRFIGKQVNGLVLNTRGAANLITMHTANDSTFIARPLNHVEFVQRNNVQLISTARGANGKIRRNDVTINRALAPVGPLVIP